MKLMLLFSIIISTSLNLFAQESKNSKNNLKPFISFNGNKSFKQNDTKYYNLSAGYKAKCNYVVGFGYSWLRGSFKSGDYGVSLLDYPDALETTKTDIKFYSFFFEPIILKDNKLNISAPLHIGISSLESKYKTNILNYETYHQSSPMFASVSADFGMRFMGFLKLTVSLGYRHLLSNLPVASETFSTPLIGFGVKIGGMCK